MSIYLARLNTARKLIEQYNGEIPFYHFLKNYFAVNKKHGSKDRKAIAALCYDFFRFRHAWPGRNFDDIIINAHYLTNREPDDFIRSTSPELNQTIQFSLDQKLELLSIHPDRIFPFHHLLSKKIDSDAFCTAMLVQPDFFIRIRPGREKIVNEKLKTAGIPFKGISGSTIAFEKTFKLEEFIKINRDVIIQDASSQKVFDELPKPESEIVDVWDACAASGGKSILFFDTISKNTRLTVSDIRPAILYNLQQRLSEAKVPVSEKFIADVSRVLPDKLTEKYFDYIICDVPCSGNGTWSRAPEIPSFFKEEKLAEFTSLQKRITFNAYKQLKPGGYFIYITCSAFALENENIIESLFSNEKIIAQHYIPGYLMNADTMFVAIIQKSF